MRYKKMVFVTFMSVFIVMATQPYLWSGVPAKIVEDIIHNDSSSVSGEKTPQEETELWEKISPSFHFEEMARMSLGEQWRNLYPKQQEEFMRLFTKNLKSSYLRNTTHIFIDKILSIEEKQGKNHAKVQTELLTRRGKEISAVFYLLNKNENWKIYDINIEGVSLISNYHSQFQSVIVHSSYDGLIQKMRQKHDKDYLLSGYELLVQEQAKRTY
ncbi:MAG: ABC transporter substrate-binding protein [Candidatus Scalindua sp.]|nr:ABC transporter substrate-binding protein [Candidatus Scalindua sp.]